MPSPSLNPSLPSVSVETAEPPLKKQPAATSLVRSVTSRDKAQQYPEWLDLLAVEEVAMAKRTHVLLKRAFPVDGLPDTPTDFIPVPECIGTAAAEKAMRQVLEAANLACIGYRSENEGVPFVNLVAMPGEGRAAEKSTQSMRGHTDAVSFPMRGEIDASDSRISCSPDAVGLCGLRNPNLVPTRIMSLAKILAKLDAATIEVLLRPDFIAHCQHTFRAGTERALGKKHVAYDVPVLARRNDGEIYVRYSHNHVVPSIDDHRTSARRLAAAKKALALFQNAAASVAEDIVVESGDLLLISNRICLHGRSEVGTETGMQTRWLLRTYGILPEEIRPENRDSEHPDRLFP